MRAFFMTSHFRDILIFLAVAGATAVAQPEGGRPPLRATAGQVSFEAIPFFTNDSASAIVDVHYRIKSNFFVVQRNLETPKESPFLGKGEMVVELRNAEGNSVAREIRPIVLNLNSMPAEDSNPPDLQGAFALQVPAGKYTVWLNVDDSQSERSFVSKDRMIDVQRPDFRSAEISDPVFVKPSGEPSVFLALNHGGSVSFGERGGYLFAVRVPSQPSDILAHYRLTLQSEYKQLEPQELKGDSVIVIDGITQLDQVKDDGKNSSVAPIEYRLAPAPAWKTLYVPLPLEQLQPGTGHLVVDFKIGESKTHREYTFHVFWRDRPRSLANLDLAADALVHIATDQEMEEFHSFSDARFVRAFMDFWKKRDPDTTTAYNEMMAEYYRRVDAADKMFSSPREVDGYKSDRGRIYILYGAPTTTQRLFSPDHPPREVWSYAKLAKRFVFEDRTRNGAYVLIAAESL